MAYITPGNLMLHSGGAGSGQHYARVANPPIHPGAMHTSMPEWYTLLDQRRIEHVPRPLQFTPAQESIPAVTFSANGWPGVRLRDIMEDRVIVDSPYDTVLAHLRWRSIIVHIEWPGYHSELARSRMHLRMDVRVGERDLTRHEIAKDVCGLLKYFHGLVTKNNYPLTPGYEKWELTTGREGIRPNDMVLLSMHYYRNVWVPEFYVIE
ncbi:hypothetical protein PAXINDRAFT_158218 [Paxillus involutus ATCC 200175]|uniref:Unplaced genomic scaffold PAXINscaffold_367, whole genome shotgun sequence n=1 Tax=Paxillus involutus ATCC 200175 TaxID=664439 RepID=A0A0C9SYF4_PAXIN|nr:hypothetical protein PAXINDRAFT_158218 [Paxillus involutus ATCC 200175]